jgi:hypothetical protein
MTAIMAAAALQQEIQHISPDNRTDKEKKRANILYNGWVNILDGDMITHLLSTTDITQKSVNSLLNASFIDRVADRTLKLDASKSFVEREYVHKNMEILLTLASLNGIELGLNFQTNTSTPERYTMTDHRDIAHFRLDAEEKYRHDGRIPLSFKKGKYLEIAKDAAMATGAFPIGLAARKISRPKQFLRENKFLYPNDSVTFDPVPIDEKEKYVTLCIDGGLLNNEPFDIAKQVLDSFSDNKSTENSRSDDNFDTTILMIDPFPSEPVVSQFNFSRGILNIVGNLLNTMREQILFKKDDIAAAFSKDDYSRFLISPVRKSSSDKTVRLFGSKAIACGALYGFSGFLSKKFREHDFYLGRRNCQRFLQAHFTVAAGIKNEIFVEGYGELAKEKYQYTDTDGKIWLPIIPDMRNNVQNAVAEEAMPFPTYDLHQLDSYDKAIAGRITAVCKGVMKDYLPSWVVSVGLLFYRKKMVKSIQKTITKDLVEWGLSAAR